MANKKTGIVDNVMSFFKLNESTFSTVLGALVVIVIGIFVYNYFKQSTPEITPVAEQTEEATPSASVETVINEKGEEVPTTLPETYTVQTGDKLWTIAEKYYGSGYNWIDIAGASKLNTPDWLAVGQELKLPKVSIRKPVIEAKFVPSITGNSYKVQKGDYLWKISLMAYGDSYKWTEIAKANNIELANASYIEIGQELKIPR